MGIYNWVLNKKRIENNVKYTYATCIKLEYIQQTV